MIFELIQPSDAMTIEAEDDKIAQIVGLLLGEGKVGVADETGRQVLPLLIFGGEKWMEENFKEPAFSDYIDKNHEAIAKSLESIVYGGIGDRKAIIAAVGNDPAAMARFNNEKRSSLNDYSAYGRQLAEGLRESARVANS